MNNSQDKYKVSNDRKQNILQSISKFKFVRILTLLLYYYLLICIMVIIIYMLEIS